MFHFLQDFRDENPDAVDDVTSALNELPALATYCVRFLSDNKSEALIAQIERFKVGHSRASWATRKHCRIAVSQTKSLVGRLQRGAIFCLATPVLFCRPSSREKGRKLRTGNQGQLQKALQLQMIAEMTPAVNCLPRGKANWRMKNVPKLTKQKRASEYMRHGRADGTGKRGCRQQPHCEHRIQ